MCVCAVVRAVPSAFWGKGQRDACITCRMVCICVQCVGARGWGYTVMLFAVIVRVGKNTALRYMHGAVCVLDGQLLCSMPKQRTCCQSVRLHARIPAW